MIYEIKIPIDDAIKVAKGVSKDPKVKETVAKEGKKIGSAIKASIEKVKKEISKDGSQKMAAASTAKEVVKN